MPLLSDCPPIAQLDPVSLSPEIDEHVTTCKRCQFLLRELAPDGLEAVETEVRLPSRRTAVPNVGDVYAIFSPKRPELQLGVVVASERGDVEAVALSEEPALATEDDAILPDDVLGFSAVIHTRVRGPVLLEQLDESLGSLPASALNGDLENGAPTLSDEDPRRRWVAELAEEWQSYWEPARSLQGTKTLGELVAHGQDRAELATSELAAAASLTASQLDAVKQDQANLVDEVKPEALATVFDQLSIIFSTKLAGRLRLALTSFAGPAPAIHSRRATRQPSASDELRRATDRYLTAVERHMRRSS